MVSAVFGLYILIRVVPDSQRYELSLSIGPNWVGFLPKDGDKIPVFEMF
jgi:hypothetical protein